MFNFTAFDKKINIIIFIFLLTISAIRVLTKYINIDMVSIIAICLYLCFLLFLLINFKSKTKIYEILSNKYLIFIVFIIMILLVFYVYPMADGLKFQMRGSDQDDCVILGVNHLINLENPYSSKSYYNNPCSPGMGMLIPYIPFVFLNIYEFGSILFLLLISIFIYKNYSLSLLNFFLIIFISNLLIVELIVVGSDLFFVAIGLLFASLYLEKYIYLLDLKKVIVIAIIVGLIASTRINFMPLTVLFFIFIAMFDRKSAIIFLIISMTISILPSYLVYISNPEIFTPLHLVGKSDLFLTTYEKITIVFFTFIISIISFFLIYKRRINFSSALLWILIPSLFGLFIGGLSSIDFKPSLSEHFNYLLPLLPLAIFNCLNSIEKYKD